MSRRSSFMLWVLFAITIAVVPLACGNDTSNDDASGKPTADAMTKS